MEIRQQIKNAILNGDFYGFVSNHQHEISKDELVTLIKEFDFTAYQNQFTSYYEFCGNVIENLNDIDFFKED